MERPTGIEFVIFHYRPNGNPDAVPPPRARPSRNEPNRFWGWAARVSRAARRRWRASHSCCPLLLPVHFPLVSAFPFADWPPFSFFPIRSWPTVYLSSRAGRYRSRQESRGHLQRAQVQREFLRDLSAIACVLIASSFRREGAVGSGPPSVPVLQTLC